MPSAPQLLPDFLAHLATEEQALRDALICLTDLHAALRTGDPAALADLQPRQEAIAAAIQDARTAQVPVAEQLARELGLPFGPIRLGTLADHLVSPAADAVRDTRDRLHALTAQIAESHRRNANLIHQLRSYLQTVFSELTADETAGRYGPHGAAVTPLGAGNAIRASG